jgi:hypothetical protein
MRPPDPAGWSPAELAALRRCQEQLPTLKADDAAAVADAVERHAAQVDSDGLSLLRQACLVLRDAEDLVSTLAGPNTAKLRHVAICRALASAARKYPQDNARVEIAQTLLALRFAPQLAWHEPDTTLGWLAVWAVGHAGLPEALRLEYAELGFPATAPALRAWYGTRSLDPKLARRLSMILLQRLEQPAIDGQLVRWIGASVTGELRLAWLTAWRRRVAGNALLSAELRKRGLTRALRALCEHDGLPICVELAHLLSELGRSDDEDYLIALLPDCDPAQQAQLARLLEWTGTRAALPALSALVARHVLSHRATRAAARQAIARIEARAPGDKTRVGALSLSADGAAGGLSLASGAHEGGALSLAVSGEDIQSGSIVASGVTHGRAALAAVLVLIIAGLSYAML